MLNKRSWDASKTEARAAAAQLPAFVAGCHCPCADIAAEGSRALWYVAKSCRATVFGDADGPLTLSDSL